MLRTIRLTTALICFTLITLLFLDFTGTLHTWFGWLAKIQFLPAVLALNLGVVLFLIALTWIFGRVYCSVICPLGVFQDIVSWLAGKRKKNRFRYSPALSWLRYGVLVIFILAMISGLGAWAALVAPYSAYGRIASNLFAPLWGWGNNLLAYLAERADSYAFYETEVWLRSLPTFIIATVTFITLIILAWRNGRTYCNTICPVGTVLGLISRFSIFKPVIDMSKCNAAACAPVIAKRPVSIQRHMKSTTAVASPAWTASTNAGREPSDIHAERQTKRKYRLASRPQTSPVAAISLPYRHYLPLLQH